MESKVYCLQCGEQNGGQCVWLGKDIFDGYQKLSSYGCQTMSSLNKLKWNMTL
jgi:hypothetical protein